jgi:vitamin B12 transporter
VFSPRAGIRYHLTDIVSAWGSIGYGFRAPTLNELYRGFRVGALQTLPNNQLGPERLLGGELGIDVEPMSNVSLRETYFDNRVRNPVSNVTIGTNLQQRQNLGRTRIWGLESEIEYRVRREWRITGAYMFNQAKVTEFAADPTLVGKYLPQVPKHRGSIGVSYSNPNVATIAVNVLFFGRQFDDDQNLRTKPGATEPGLPGYGTVELSALRSIGRNLDVFFGVQNLFDQEYYVLFQPTTVGSPRMVNGGIRVRFTGR